MIQNKQEKKGEIKFFINKKELERMEEYRYLRKNLSQDKDDTTKIIWEKKKYK